MSGSILLMIVGIILTAVGMNAAGNIVLLIIGLLLILLSIYSTYQKLIICKNKVQEAFSGIDVHLKKRYDLIPNILTIANKFMEHEKSLLEEITRLRTQAVKIPSSFENLAKKGELDSLIQGKMGQLMVAVENYPQLKSDQTMITAMQTYNEVEEHICAARRFYNAAVNELNNAVDIFPSSIFASLMHIERQPYFEIEESHRAPISASEFLK